MGFPVSVPEKMTSCMLAPRSCLSPLFTQHPAHRVCHVALSAAVGAHDAGDSVVELEQRSYSQRI